MHNMQQICNKHTLYMQNTCEIEGCSSLVGTSQSWMLLVASLNPILPLLVSSGYSLWNFVYMFFAKYIQYICKISKKLQEEICKIKQKYAKNMPEYAKNMHNTA